MTSKKTHKMNRATFGSVRQLRSGRWQARYPAVDGTPMTGPQTYATSKDAWTHIARVRADRSRPGYIDPRNGAKSLSTYATEWINNGGSRGNLAQRTQELYRSILAKHIEPTLGHRDIGKITPDMVRTWYSRLGRDLAEKIPEALKDGSAKKSSRTGTTRQGQAYRLLHAVFATAVEDELIARNPCAIKGAGSVKLSPRPLLTVSDFTAIVEAHSKDLQPMLHLALGAHLRLGELVGLRVKDWDAVAGTITVDGQLIRTEDGVIRTTPKTQSSKRTVVLPAITAEILRAHLARTPKALPNAPLLMRSSGRPVIRSGLQSAWKRARTKVGMEQFTFHDLRSSGLTLAAQGGATIPDLMARAGHSTSTAALLYQRTAVERGAVIAASMDAALRRNSATA